MDGASDGEARSVVGPGVAGGCQDTSATTTPGAGQAFDLSTIVGHYIQVEAEVADVYINFLPAGTTPAAGNFDPTTVVKDFSTPATNRKVPLRIVVGVPRHFVVQAGYTLMAYRGATATGTIRAVRG